MEKKIKLKKLTKMFSIILIIVFLFTIINLLVSNTSAYYSNIKNFYSFKADGFGGFALERDNTDFIENGCGLETMLDTLTGLCWEKNLNSLGAKTWANSVDYCNNLVLGGHDDWRLPEVDELMSLIDEIGGLGSTCPTLESFNFINCESGIYWGINDYFPSPTSACAVDLHYGVSQLNSPKTETYYVACVR